MNGFDVKVLMRDAKKFPILTREQEQELVAKAKNGDKQAKDLLINSNIKFALRRAYTYKQYCKGKVSIRFEDVVQAALTGLVVAADKYDPSKNTKFITYAVFWINAYIMDFIKSNFSEVKFSHSQASKALFFKQKQVKAISELAEESRDNARKQLAKSSNITVKDVMEMEERLNGADVRCFSVSRVLGPDKNRIESDSNKRGSLEDSVNFKQIVQMVNDIVDSSCLNEREKKVIQGRFFEEKKLNAIGNELGVCRERARQIEVEALDKMRKVFESKNVDASVALM